jgi:ABC-type multidrug transport system fused ATPase/permease subunit
MAVLLFYGGRIILLGESFLGAEEFIYFLVVFSSIIPCISDISRAGYGIRKAQASVDRINTVLNIPENMLQIAESDGEILDVSLDEDVAIELNNVSFSYGSELNKAVDNLSIKVLKGSKVAIVGHTGSGKSTVAKLIPRFLELDSGNISILGEDIHDVSIYGLRDSISYVSQEPMLFNDTIYNNIAFGNDDVDLSEVINLAKKLGLHDFIETLPLGYDTVIGDRGAFLSGGQKQGISILRALLKKAPIIILDEATSALDPESETRVMNFIDNIEGLTKIIITHRLSSIQKCDQVIVMKNGSVIESGSPLELFCSGGYFANTISV